MEGYYLKFIFEKQSTTAKTGFKQIRIRSSENVP
jgi:hypothetical protein